MGKIKLQITRQTGNHTWLYHLSLNGGYVMTSTIKHEVMEVGYRLRDILCERPYRNGKTYIYEEEDAGWSTSGVRNDNTQRGGGADEA